MSPSSSQTSIAAIGQRQSPIDIVTETVQAARRLQTRSAGDEVDGAGGEVKANLVIDYSAITSSSGELSLENTGHGWKLNIPDAVGELCRKFFRGFQLISFSPFSFPSAISGGPLGSDKYRLLQVHAHWGKDNTSGSEHTVNGKSFPCEVRLKREIQSIDLIAQLPLFFVGAPCPLERQQVQIAERGARAVRWFVGGGRLHRRRRCPTEQGVRGDQYGARQDRGPRQRPRPAARLGGQPERVGARGFEVLQLPRLTHHRTLQRVGHLDCHADTGVGHRAAGKCLRARFVANVSNRSPRE